VKHTGIVIDGLQVIISLVSPICRSWVISQWWVHIWCMPPVTRALFWSSWSKVAVFWNKSWYWYSL